MVRENKYKIYSVAMTNGREKKNFSFTVMLVYSFRENV